MDFMLKNILDDALDAAWVEHDKSMSRIVCSNRTLTQGESDIREAFWAEYERRDRKTPEWKW